MVMSRLSNYNVLHARNLAYCAIACKLRDLWHRIALLNLVTECAISLNLIFELMLIDQQGMEFYSFHGNLEHQLQ